MFRVSCAGAMLILAGMATAAATDLTSPYTFAGSISYQSHPSSFGPTQDEVEFYKINTYIFEHEETGVDYVDNPAGYMDACQRLYPDPARGEGMQGENIAWLEARVILGLLDMYKATGNDDFLEQIVVHADRIFNCRLDRRNQTLGQALSDTQRNVVSFKGWPTYSYFFPLSTANRVSHSVHSGYFVYALAKFVRYVRERNITTFLPKANEYVPLLQESLEAFDSERDSNGLYVFPGTTNRPWKIWVDAQTYINATNVVQPINMQAAMGSALLEMQAISCPVPGTDNCLSSAERSSYRVRATQIANYIHGQLTLNSVSDSYTWPYWHWDAGTCTEDTTDTQPETVANGVATCTTISVEDVSHAAMDVDFVVSSVTENLGVFTPTDLRRFAHTLVSVVRLPANPHLVRSTVDGLGGFTDSSPDVVYWMALAQYDAGVYTWLSDLLDEADISPLATGPQGYLPDSTGKKFDRDYQGYAAYLKMKYSPALHPVNLDTQTQEHTFVGDFGGTSAKDVLQHINGIGWRLLISNGTNFDVSFVSPSSVPDVEFPLLGDFNGDARSDLLFYDSLAATPGWYVRLAEPAPNTSQKHRLGAAVLWSTAGSGGTSARHVVGDFKFSGSGNHLDDLAYYVSGSGWRVLASNGSAFSTEQWSTAGSGVDLTQRAADVYVANAYGRDLLYYTGSAWRALLAWSSSGTWRFDDYTSAAATQGTEIHTADFTQDGRDDMLRYLSSGPSGSGWYVIPSSSYGFPGSTWSFTESRWSSAGMGVAGSSIIGDFNNDQLPDLAYYTDVLGQSGWRVFLNNSGTGFAQPSLWSPAGQGTSARGADVTGDNRTDIIQYVDDLGGWRVLKSTGSALSDEMWYGPRGL